MRSKREPSPNRAKDVDRFNEQIAESAFDKADAMMAERARRRGEPTHE